MNPVARLALALVVGVGIGLVRPGSAVAWAFGFAGFLIVMGSGGRSRRRY